MQSLLLTLKESHRARTMFRKTGGFSFLISVILSMENCLVASPQPPWDKASKSDIFDLLKTILHTIVISMRYEPANAKFFEVEVRDFLLSRLLLTFYHRAFMFLSLSFQGQMDESLLGASARRLLRRGQTRV